MSIAIKPLAVWCVRERHANRPVVTPKLAMYIATFQPIFAWWLPTEVVVRKPTTVTPRSANCWSMSAEAVRDLLGLSLAEWPSMTEWTDGNFTCRRDNYAYLIELHSDSGDDGHTDSYRHGFALLSMHDFGVYLKYMTAFNDGKDVEEVYIDD